MGQEVSCNPVLYIIFQKYPVINSTIIKKLTSKNLAASISGFRFSSVTLVSPQYINSMRDLRTQNFMSLSTIKGCWPSCLLRTDCRKENHFVILSLLKKFQHTISETRLIIKLVYFNDKQANQVIILTELQS